MKLTSLSLLTHHHPSQCQFLRMTLPLQHLRSFSTFAWCRLKKSSISNEACTTLHNIKNKSTSILQLSCSVEKVAWAQNQSIVSWAEPDSWSHCRDQEQLLQNHTVKETPAHTIKNFDMRSNKLYCFICTQKLKLSNWVPLQGPPIFLCQSLDLRLILSLKLFSRWMELPYIWPDPKRMSEAGISFITWEIFPCACTSGWCKSRGKRDMRTLILMHKKCAVIQDKVMSISRSTTTFDIKSGMLQYFDTWLSSNTEDVLFCRVKESKKKKKPKTNKQLCLKT